MPLQQRVVESQVKGVAEPAEEAARAATNDEESTSGFGNTGSGDTATETFMGSIGEAVIYSCLARLTTTGADSSAVYMIYTARDSGGNPLDVVSGPVSNHPIQPSPPLRVPADGDVEVQMSNFDTQTNDGVVGARYVEVD